MVVDINFPSEQDTLQVDFENLQIIKGKDGTTFTPYIENGWLCWTNDGGLPNPDPFYLGSAIEAMSLEEAIEGTNEESKTISAFVLHTTLDVTITDSIQRSY